MSDPGKTLRVERPRLQRMALLKALLQGFRVRLDEELHPLGITTAQLRMLWTVELTPDVSGAEVARLCSVTPQTGQALLSRMESQGWIRRRASKRSERVLVAELTASGRRVLEKARVLAEKLDAEVWAGTDQRVLRTLDQVLVQAAGRLNSRTGCDAD